MATAFDNDPAYGKVDIDAFLDMDFGGRKAELDDGVIFMMAGGGMEHAGVAANIIASLHPRLRGTGCRPFGSDLAVQTGPRSIRYPDVSIFCRPYADDGERNKLVGEPRAVFEVLSPSTARLDERTKLPEYMALAGVQDIVLVDPDTRRVRHVRRTGPYGWADDWVDTGAIHLASVGLDLALDEIFAAD